MVDKEKTMRLELVIKSGTKILAAIAGREMTIQPEDVNKIIDAEQYLERLFGYRFHIHLCTLGKSTRAQNLGFEPTPEIAKEDAQTPHPANELERAIKSLDESIKLRSRGILTDYARGRRDGLRSAFRLLCELREVTK